MHYISYDCWWHDFPLLLLCIGVKPALMWFLVYSAIHCSVTREAVVMMEVFASAALALALGCSAYLSPWMVI